MRRVRAHCTNCKICAGNRCLVCTLAFVGILLLSSSLYLSPSLPLFLHLLRIVVSLGADHRCARSFDNREQCTYSRGLVYALSYVGSFGTLCPSVVSCILYQSSGTSRGSLLHWRVPARCYLINVPHINVPLINVPLINVHLINVHHINVPHSNVHHTYKCASYKCASFKNEVEQCACCGSLTNGRHHRHDFPTLSPTQKVFRFRQTNKCDDVESGRVWRGVR